MTAYSVSKKFLWTGRMTDKTSAVMRMFGVDVDRLDERAIEHRLKIDILPGDIVYLSGPSGSGKSVILDQLYETIAAGEAERSDDDDIANDSGGDDRKFCGMNNNTGIDNDNGEDKGGDNSNGNCNGNNGCIRLGDIDIAGALSAADRIDADVLMSLRILSVAGLSDVFSVIKPVSQLSEGQKWRFRLAAALASGAKYIFADEFCTNLDRLTAGVIAHKVHKFAKEKKVTFILASCHNDILMDLGPDVLVSLDLTGGVDVLYQTMERTRLCTR